LIGKFRKCILNNVVHAKHPRKNKNALFIVGEGGLLFFVLT